MDNINYKIIVFVSVLGSEYVKEPSRIFLPALRGEKENLLIHESVGHPVGKWLY